MTTKTMRQQLIDRGHDPEAIEDLAMGGPHWVAMLLDGAEPVDLVEGYLVDTEDK